MSGWTDVPAEPCLVVLEGAVPRMFSMYISACWASWEGRAGHGPEAEGRDDQALKREVAY
jgi:hypothetical protein